MKSFCIYILDLNYDLNQLFDMVSLASKKAFPGESLDTWIGFNGFYVKEVIDHFNFKLTKLNPSEALDAFDRIIFIGFDEEVVKNLSTDTKVYNEYTIKEIEEKTSTKAPLIMPYEVIKSRGDMNSLLDCMNKYKGREERYYLY